jgi:hypothetical protein
MTLFLPAILGSATVLAAPVLDRRDAKDTETRADIAAAFPFWCGSDELQKTCTRPNADSYCTTSGVFVSGLGGTCMACVCVTAGGGCTKCAALPPEAS